MHPAFIKPLKPHITFDKVLVKYVNPLDLKAAWMLLATTVTALGRESWKVTYIPFQYCPCEGTDSTCTYPSGRSDGYVARYR